MFGKRLILVLLLSAMASMALGLPCDYPVPNYPCMEDSPVSCEDQRVLDAWMHRAGCMRMRERVRGRSGAFLFR